MEFCCYHGVVKCVVIPILEAEAAHVDQYIYTYILATDDKSNLHIILHGNILTHWIL